MVSPGMWWGRVRMGVNTKELSLAARVKITKRYAQACAAAPGKD